MPHLDNSTNIAGVQFKDQGSDLTTPASGYHKLEAKANGLYIIDSSGNVFGPITGTLEATVSTTDATVTTLLTFTIPATTTYAIRARVVARRTGGASGTAEDGAYYERSAAFKNVAGSATQIGSTASIATMEDQAGWDVTFDVTGATARIRVTGAANNNVDWSGRFEIIQVS